VNDGVRIGAIGDLHVTADGAGALRDILSRANGAIEALVLCGDLTDRGLPDEARALAHGLASVKAPIVAVLGNHDFEAGRQDEIAAILRDAGVKVLDGEGVEIGELGFAGAKGFAGGFGIRALEPWGESAIKAFVNEAVSEAVKLGGALAKLRTPHKIAVLHYSPVVDTVVGEPPEIYAFLGSTRLAEPIDRYGASLVVHGHAHSGAPEGRTRAGIPVYNVSLPLLRRTFGEPASLRILDLAPAVATRSVATR
jgi:Icc-related predicted phosphoesterase